MPQLPGLSLPAIPPSRSPRGRRVPPASLGELIDTSSPDPFVLALGLRIATTPSSHSLRTLPLTTQLVTASLKSPHQCKPKLSSSVQEIASIYPLTSIVAMVLPFPMSSSSSLVGLSQDRSQGTQSKRQRGLRSSPTRNCRLNCLKLSQIMSNVYGFRTRPSSFAFILFLTLLTDSIAPLSPILVRLISLSFVV
jgi:hypothetical protein